MSQQILPFYLVCDESWSMSGEPIEAINESLKELHQEIGSNPVVADKTRFCLISFNHQAQVLLPLTDLSDLEDEMPGMAGDGGTSYGTVFTLIRDTIDKDVAALKAAGNQVLRPAVFFLTDGQPNDSSEWGTAHRRLTDPAWGRGRTSWRSDSATSTATRSSASRPSGRSSPTSRCGRGPRCRSSRSR